MSKTAMEVVGQWTKNCEQILTPEALEFIAKLQRKFSKTRKELIASREARAKEINSGKLPTFIAETVPIRNAEWKVASCPKDLENRRVEITGPAEAKMMINALNSGANAFMADLEDSLSPTWDNVIDGQLALKQAVRKTLAFSSPEGKSYKLNNEIATLLVRPRGWHLEEKHVKVDGEVMSGSLFDFGLYFFHNAQERMNRGTAPYFYLPKLESHLEARLWNDVFCFAQDELKIPRGTIRATVLIETILAVFDMDEILYELKEHMSGLNAGRWDYIFSAIKKFRNFDWAQFPDRAQISMTVPFMRSYTELLVKTCHRRNAHAMGGMSAFVPSRKDAAVNEAALKKVRDDKKREATDGFDGTWVAHPDLVSVAQSEFEAVLGNKPNQKDRLRADVKVNSQDLIAFKSTGGEVTEAGIRMNINVALQYLERWISGVGAAAIHNLMEDAATAEISRAQLWQWIKQGKLTQSLYTQIRDEELKLLGGRAQGKYDQSANLLDELVLTDDFPEFLTIPAYGLLN
ncbi:MAG: malate synthase A [Xanthomonadaceae bacterium]|nr:malate synthase A [Xanthomonadaceae bacterium]